LFLEVNALQHLRKELVSFTNEAPVDTLPDTIVVAGLEEIIDKSETVGVKSDRKFGQSFAKLAAILQDFSLFCSGKNDQNFSRLVCFVKFSTSQERFLAAKLRLWFPEVWKLSSSSLVCKTSLTQLILKFYLKDDQYYLESMETE